MKKRSIAIAVLIAAIVCGGSVTAGAKTKVLGKDPLVDPAGQMKKTDGTRFEVTGSDYLNLKVESSKNIDLTVRSIPEVVTMTIAPNADTKGGSTKLTISGFAPDTVYYRYEDDLHNVTKFRSDKDGRYTFVQDLQKPHLIIIKPRKSTIFIKDDDNGGDCMTIGMWNTASKTCYININVNETIQIDSDNITIEGNGKTINGGPSGTGFMISSKTGITINNVNVSQTSIGLLAYNSNNITIERSSFNDGAYGIYLVSSVSNTLLENTATGNMYYGLAMEPSSLNTITENTFSNNGVNGIRSGYGSIGNTITDNYIQENGDADININVSDPSSGCTDTMTGNIGSGGRPIGYYRSMTAISDQTFSELILCDADYSVLQNVVISGSDTLQNNMLFIDHTDLAQMSGITSTDNVAGVFFNASTNNTLTGDSFSSNRWYGIALYNSTYNTVENGVMDGNGVNNVFIGGSYGMGNIIRNNDIQNSGTGLSIGESFTNNQIYGNNFLNNGQQVMYGVGNTFVGGTPYGGNYWDTYDTPAEGCDNADNNSFCDVTYFTYPQYMPLSGMDFYPFITQRPR